MNAFDHILETLEVKGKKNGYQYFPPCHKFQSLLALIIYRIKSLIKHTYKCSKFHQIYAQLNDESN